MNTDNLKITDNEIKNNNVKSARDTYPKGDTQNNKSIFDRLPELIAAKFNALVEKLKDRVYEKDEVDSRIRQQVQNAVFETGAADMAKAIYDADGDNMVDRAKNGVFEYVDTVEVSVMNGVHTVTDCELLGTGKMGRFLCVRPSGLYSTIKINGEEYAVNCAGENYIDMVRGRWYFFVIEGQTINFSSGGGLTKSKLEQATATEKDVAAGKTFFSGTKDVKTGKAKCMATVETSTEGTAREYVYTATSSGNILAVFSYGDRNSGPATIECVCSNSGVTVRELADHRKVRGSSDYRYAKTAVGIYLAEGVKEGDILTFTATDNDNEYEVPVCLGDLIKLDIGAEDEYWQN